MNSERFEEIMKHARQWQVTIDAVKDFIFVLNGDERIMLSNLAFSERVKKHPKDIVGLKVCDLSDFSLPDVYCIGEDAVQNGRPVTMEVRMEDEIYLVNAFPARFDEEKVCVYVMKNVTELSELRNKLFHSHKMATIGRLVAGIAHEINNPLTGIMGFCEILGMKLRDENQRKDLEEIYGSALRCKHIVESLFAFARQETPEKNLDNINDIIGRTIELRAYWFRRNKVQIVQNPGDVPLAFLDSQQIQEVILNILVNAENAIMESGRPGQIDITTALVPGTKNVRITIADNGTGIPEENLDRIFEPFFTTMPVNVGAGLGLSIAYGIISEHGGTIRAENRKGGGAAFVIELPLR